MKYEGYSVIRVSVDDGVANVVVDNPPINLFNLTLYADMDRVVRQGRRTRAPRERSVGQCRRDTQHLLTERGDDNSERVRPCNRHA
ncbi:MAG: hypothetical protein ACKOIZ_05875, partial [Actinomycetota bacterium]